MKLVKKNIKLIIIITLCIFLTSGISVFATYKYLANEVEYTEGKSVEEALNELYANKKETSDTVKEITENGEQTLDKYYNKLNVNVTIPDGYLVPSGTKSITKNGTYDVTNESSVNVNIPAQYAILETGSYTTSTISGGNYIKCTINFSNSYSSAQNAYFVITGSTGTGSTAFYAHTTANRTFTGNKKEFYLVNYGTGSGTCTINYAVIGIPSSLLN